MAGFVLLFSIMVIRICHYDSALHAMRTTSHRTTTALSIDDPETKPPQNAATVSFLARVCRNTS